MLRARLRIDFQDKDAVHAVLRMVADSTVLALAGLGLAISSSMVANLSGILLMSLAAATDVRAPRRFADYWRRLSACH
jgi:hypothetical protein